MDNDVLDIQRVLEPTVAGLGFEFVGMECIIHNKTTLLRVYVDKPAGINVGELTNVSRQLSGLLDVEDIICGQYRLEVSSPGMDRPLFKLAHYQQMLGSNIKLSLREPRGEQRNFIGRLSKVVDKAITVEIAGERIVFQLGEIEKARVVPDFGQGTFN